MSPAGSALPAARAWRPALIACVALGLGLWGIRWCLPDRGRVSRVLPPSADTQEFRRHLAETWRERNEKLGPDPWRNPAIWSAGFERVATVPAGWTSPPPLLVNSARSFNVRTGYADEAHVLIYLSKLRPDRLQFDPQVYAYGAAYFWGLGGWIAALSAVTPTKIVPSLDYYLEHLDKLAWMYLSGRLFSVAMLVAGALLLYAIGLRCWGPDAGLWAGLFYAAAPGNVFLTHVMKPGPMGFTCLLGLLFFCVEILQGRNQRSRWVWAGIMLGLAAGATNYLAAAGVMLWVTVLLRSRWSGADWRRDARDACLASVLGAAVYLLTNPFLVYDGGTTWPLLLGFSQHSSRSPAEMARWLLIGLPKALSLPVALWALYGSCSRETRAEPAGLLALSSLAFFLGLTWILQDGGRLDGIRHTPTGALACLLAGCAAARLSRPSARGPWAARAAKAAAAASVCYACLSSGVMDRNYHLESVGRSTKQAAGDWIEANLPAGAEIGFLRLLQPADSPYFQWARYRLRFVEETALAGASAPELLPEHLVLAMYDHDPRPALREVLRDRYVLLRGFEPFSTRWVRLPTNEFYANPLLEIYRRKDVAPAPAQPRP